MSPSGPRQRSTSSAVRAAVTNCWSMKPSLMPPLAWRNSAGNIRAECPRWGVQAVTAILWSMSIKKYSPPRGRYVCVHNGVRSAWCKSMPEEATAP
jgi:hypothetical protein